MPLRLQYFRHSFVQSCSFHNTTATSINITNSSWIAVTDTVVYSTAASAITIHQGNSNTLDGNLALSLEIMDGECAHGLCVNLCESAPCQHGASCIVLSEDQFACICPADWTGTRKLDAQGVSWILWILALLLLLLGFLLSGF